MNTAPFRRAGSTSHLAPPKSSRLTLALLGGAATIILAAAGFVIVGLSGPDTTQTAAVPPHMQLPADASGATDDNDGAATAPKQARNPTAQMPAPLASDAARLQPTPAAESPAGPERHETIAATQAGPQPAKEAMAPDATDTASIPADELRGPQNVQVAENEAEIAELEAATGMVEEEPQADSETQPPPAAPATKLAAVSQPDLKPATVTKDVNLREGPADEAEVLTVVPANANIEAEADCGWCTVVYKGQRGYIYKSFINRGAAAAEGAADGQGLY